MQSFVIFVIVLGWTKSDMIRGEAFVGVQLSLAIRDQTIKGNETKSNV